MKPQLTLQTPLELPPEEVSNYLEKLWISENEESVGANTFTLVVWQPSWLEQCLVLNKLLCGPITGNLTPEIIEAAKEQILKKGLPHTTLPNSNELINILKDQILNENVEDLRGQFFESSISTLNPRRLITLAPSFTQKEKLKTFVSAYCPLNDDFSTKGICGDLTVIRGDSNSIKEKGLKIVDQLDLTDLPSWLWWNGNLDESKEIFDHFLRNDKRLIIDTANGSEKRCLDVLSNCLVSRKAINDLNWLRLRSWRESLAMIFDPPSRREILNHITDIDVDIQSNHLLQALFLISWISDKLKWEFISTRFIGDSISIEFQRSNGELINTSINTLPLGNPSIHNGQVIGLRLISKISKDPKKNTCIILGAESAECMRLEAGGMADMQLIEEVVPNSFSSSESDVSKLLASSRGSTSPLFEKSIEKASKIFNNLKIES